MLTIKTNKNNCKITYVPLNVNSIVTGETVYDDITITTDKNHNLKENDEVAFIRQDGDSISYFKDCEVKEAISKTGFTIDGFGKYTISVNGYRPSFIKYSSNVLADNYDTILYTKDGDIINITGRTINSDNIVSTITAISIGYEVENISEDAFTECKYLKKISIRPDNKKYSVENNVLFNKIKTELICYPSRKEDSSYIIPSTVEKIGNNAFNGAINLTDVTIPSFVERIGNNAFSGCSSLTEVTCKPIDPPIISDTTFDKSILEKIYVKEEQVKRYKTAWKKLKSKIYGDENIVDDEKNDKKVTRLYLNVEPYIVEITGSTLDSGISENYASSLRSVEIGTDVTVIGDRAFSNCRRLTSVIIPNNVTNIGNYAFYSCADMRFSLIVIPDSITSIGDYAFAECTHLMLVYIGNSVTKIGKHAFYNIYGNSRFGANIYLASSEAPVLGDSYVFSSNDVRKTPNFYVPNDVLNRYRGCYMSPNSLIDLSDAYNKYYICLNTNEHIFATNKDDVNIRRRYIWDSNSGEFKYDGVIRMCDGDYYSFDDLFLIQNDNNIDTIQKNITLNITASTANYAPILLTNCLIGIDYAGRDDRYHIYIPYDENIDFASKLEDLLQVTRFTTDDIRFLCNENNQMEFGCELQPGTQVDKKCGNIEVDFNIGDSFEANLHHNEQINSFIDKVKKESINKIIDYERHQYTPMYYSGRIPITESSTDEYLMKNYEIDENLKEVTEIRFQLNFRDKFYTLYNAKGEVIPEDSEDVVDSVDFGTWQTDDSKYWNNYTLSSDQKHLDYVYRSYNVYGDLLGYLGFTDDDVYYQKDALKKSFLRLSFYDSPNRETQKLLYYSTVYFDTNVLSSNYIKDLNEWRNDVTYTPRYNQLVFAYDIARRYKTGKTLTAEMSCTDKYDDTKSSDGFYIHLFDKLVSGNTCRAIYMKAEFNNAKFGKTVPMIMPVFKNSNERIPPVNTKFPREYVKKKANETGDIYTYADIESLMRDMYIKIFIKYDFKTNQYVWFLPKHQDEDVIKLELFEPRVKGYDLASYNELNGNEVGYGTIDGTPNWFQGKFIKEDNKYVWFLEEGGNKYSEFGSEYTERLPELDNYTCLMTTATTLQGENMLNGTKLFNSKNINKIASIWIDGMMVYDENHYSGGVYTTDRVQLPDIPFDAICLDDDEYKSFTWNPDETREVWNDKDEIWEDVAKNPKKIHRVNYYFRSNKKNQESLINELYLGVKGKKKTIETTREICNLISNGLSLNDAETIPSGFFSKIASLRCVRIINDEKHFSAIGNGCFNCCKSLVRLEIQEGVINIIGKNAFSGCASLKEAKLSDTKIILKEAFQGCYTLTVLKFKTDGDSTRYIGCGSFGNTKIRNITLPNSIVRIGNSAFRRCFQLGWIAIKDGSSSCLIGGFGKRVFSDSARYKYNLSPLVDKKDRGFYYYYGGIPNIIKDSIRYNYKVKFYDAFRQKQVTLSIIDNKDRGKLNSQFKDKEYQTYLNKTKNRVYCFSKWLRYIF